MAFLITTTHNASTRWPRIKDELMDQGIDVFPILATDYNLFKHTDLNTAQYKQQSLTMAYLTACQTAVYLGIDQFTIFEDDVKVIDPNQLDMTMLNYPDQFDLCYLTETDHNQKSAKTYTVDENWQKILGNWWETPATLWSIRFAKVFIHHIENKIKSGLWLGHVDHELMKLCESGEFNFFGSRHRTCIGLSNSEQTEMSVEGSIHLDVN